MQFLEALAKIQAEDSKLSERIVPVSRLTAEPDGSPSRARAVAIRRAGV